jgi:hypothetical protein
MTLCVNCGVELDEGLLICPLCGKDPEKKVEEKNRPKNSPAGIIHLQKKENRRYLWELSGIIAFSGIAACTIIDLLISKELKWSLLSDISIVTAWVIMTLYLFAFKRTWIIVSLLLITVLTSLFLLDFIAAGGSWFLPLGLPVTIAVFVSAVIILLLYKSVHMNGLNIIASAFIVLSGFCILVEIIVDKYMDGIVNYRWSLFVAVAILPVALVLFFYHYRLKKGNRLDSFFHI